MAEPKLIVTFPDGAVFELPASVVATDFAKFCESNGESYEAAYKEIMESDRLLEDWAVGNMDWSDLKLYSIQVEPARPHDYEAEYYGAEFEVSR